MIGCGPDQYIPTPKDKQKDARDYGTAPPKNLHGGPAADIPEI